MQDILENLNPIQSTIVKDTEGYVLTLAGAGSGKTRVLTHRIAYLLQNGVKPWGILAVTFTNKAARNMREKVTELSGDHASQVWMGTFHSICVRILRRFGGEIGLPNFTIIDEKERATLLKQCATQLGFEYEVPIMVSAIGNAKNDLLTPPELLALAQRRHEQEISHIYQVYEDKKNELGYVDYDDLIMKAVLLLQNSTEARETYQKQFRYVLADESQDTNEAQYLLLDLLTGHHKNLFLVGDIDQSIYKWRGAKISNVLKFQERYPEARIHKLEQNYRSTQTIVDAANAVISHNKERIEKTAYTDKGWGEPILAYQAEDDVREADFVASAIRRIVQVEGKDYKDFAVLYRTGRQSRSIELAFTQAGLPYQVIGGLNYYDRKEIKDIICYLRLMVNDVDSLAMNRVINVPKRGIGDTTVQKIEDYAAICQIPFPKALEHVENIATISKGTKTKIEGFVTFINELREFARQPDQSVAEIILEILRRTGYRDNLDPDKDEDASRLENIEELINVAAQWDQERTEEKTIADFLSETTLASDVDGLEDDNKIKLMTAHSAKGLEFPVVFIIGLEENILPHVRSLADPADLEEERRIMYVGITRAELRLFLTYCRNRYEYGDPRPKQNKPSRFLGEIPATLIRRLG